MNRFAILLVVLGFSLILALVGSMLGGSVADESLAFASALGALAACASLVGGLVLLERRAQDVSRPYLTA
ncbi:hypothetical protein [Roseomonas sp. BN140053]|uniref:hypothetical protein n=1 Tax=Roseomonas sp. BN140053 TaxID=3391898 RepID=UPI0039E927AF